MPFIDARGVRLYYEIHGRALRPTDLPLLLIAGLGFATWCWFKQLPVLGQHYAIIVFDNRGSGRSEKPPHLYDVATLADDAAALLTALGVPRAYVLGTSLGGFIAQELALRHPERVARLILCSTSFGGPRSIPMRWPVLKATLGWGAPTRALAIRKGLEVATSRAYRQACADELERIIGWRQHDQLQPSDYFRQVLAGVRFDAARRVQAIAAPTLVIHGAEDRVVPVANAVLLAQTIPRARLRIINGAGHLVFIERAAEVNRAILAFLGAGPPGGRAGARRAGRWPTRRWQWLRSSSRTPAPFLAGWWRRAQALLASVARQLRRRF